MFRAFEREFERVNNPYSSYLDASSAYTLSAEDMRRAVKVLREQNQTMPQYYEVSSDLFKNCEYKINEPKQMSTLNSMMKRLLDKDTKALVEASFINGNLELTDVGWAELKTIVFEQHKDELVKIAEEKVKEEKKK